jgi:hypothetical protein
MQNEIWKDITWYEWKYQVSNLWNLKSLWRIREYYLKWKKIKYLQPLKILKLNDFNWYKSIELSKTKRRNKYYVHRLVAQAFLWLDISDKKTLVCHKDDNRKNNKVENLFLWTHKDNMQDMIKKWRNKGWRKKIKNNIQ